MFAILRGANGRRHEVDFGDDPVTVDVAMSPTTVQVTMAAADPGDLARSRFELRGGSVCLNSSVRCGKWSPAGFRLLRIAAACRSRPGPARRMRIGSTSRFVR